MAMEGFRWIGSFWLFQTCFPTSRKLKNEPKPKPLHILDLPDDILYEIFITIWHSEMDILTLGFAIYCIPTTCKCFYNLFMPIMDVNPRIPFPQYYHGFLKRLTHFHPPPSSVNSRCRSIEFLVAGQGGDTPSEWTIDFKMGRIKKHPYPGKCADAIFYFLHGQLFQKLGLTPNLRVIKIEFLDPVLRDPSLHLFPSIMPAMVEELHIHYRFTEYFRYEKGTGGEEKKIPQITDIEKVKRRSPTRLATPRFPLKVLKITGFEPPKLYIETWMSVFEVERLVVNGTGEM